MFAEAAPGTEEKIVDGLFAEQGWAQRVEELLLPEKPQGRAGDGFRRPERLPRGGQRTRPRIAAGGELQGLFEQQWLFLAAGDVINGRGEAETGAGNYRLRRTSLQAGREPDVFRQFQRQVECQQPALVMGFQRDRIGNGAALRLDSCLLSAGAHGSRSRRLCVEPGTPGLAIVSVEHRAAPVKLVLLRYFAAKVSAKSDFTRLDQIVQRSW